eukprot:scaffold367680_cov47-Attheya_sp.AAC.5
MLSIEFDPIDARKFHPMMPKDTQQVIDALFVRLVPRFQSLPSQRLGRLSPQLQLFTIRKPKPNEMKSSQPTIENRRKKVIAAGEMERTATNATFQIRVRDSSKREAPFAGMTLMSSRT